MYSNPLSTPLEVDLGPDRSYPIVFGPLTELPAAMTGVNLPPGRCLIVTDETVASLYTYKVERGLENAGWRPYLITLPPGETTKSFQFLVEIYDQALSWGIDRETPLVAVGGGVTGDLGGFAAATLLRGIPLVQVPTTLIAQVDSAIGGKTGINHPSGKNLIGSFHQPRLVYADAAILSTLPPREWTSGLAEVVKHALIADEELFGALESGWAALIRREGDPVRNTLIRAAGVKAAVVSRDERESGLRAILNFGHTFAHAIEKTTGYGTFTHGEAVAVGMRAALYLSMLLHPDLDFERADALVARIPLATGLGDASIDQLISAMQADKKAKAGELRFVVLDRIGHAYVTDAPSIDQVRAAWEFACRAAVAA